MDKNALFKRWLREQLLAIDSVRACVIDREAALVAYTWSGALIHVHLVEEATKARTIKKIVSEATRVGIGTLFLVNAALVPADGSKVSVDEGLLALHALFGDKLYTYRCESSADGKPVFKVGQVHFKSFGRGDEREIWYGPDVEIKHLPAYRVWVKAPLAVKGDWLIANFGTEAFWKSADYSAMRDAFRQQQRSGSTHYQTWSAGSTWGTPPPESEAPRGYGGGSAPRPPETRLDRCYAQLGLQRGATSDEVKAAFRRLARELHPDVSKLPKEEAENRFKILSEAYTLIRTTNGW